MKHISETLKGKKEEIAKRISHQDNTSKVEYKKLESAFHKAKPGPESHKAAMAIHDWSKKRLV